MINLDFLKPLFFKNPSFKDKESVRYAIDTHRENRRQEDLETKFVTGSGNVFADSGIDEPTAFTRNVKLSASNKKPETLKLDHLTKRQLEGIIKSTELALNVSESSKEILQLERTLKVFKKALGQKVGKNDK